RRGEKTAELILHAASSGEFPGLEALFTEDRTPLCRLEGNGRFLPAGRTRGYRLHAFAGNGRTRGATRPLALAGIAPFRLVLEVLVGEELLLSRRPDELRPAVHAPEQPVLELHRSLPRRARTLVRLLQLPPEFLAIALARKRLLCPTLVA